MELFLVKHFGQWEAVAAVYSLLDRQLFKLVVATKASFQCCGQTPKRSLCIFDNNILNIRTTTYVYSYNLKTLATRTLLDAASDKQNCPKSNTCG